MKTYEEMARDVLKRRDEELSALQNTSQLNAPPEVVYPGVTKKRSWIPKIAIPCAAAVLVGAVGFTAWKNLHRGRYENPFVAEGDQPVAPENSDGVVFTLVAEQPAESIYKGGKTEIYINEATECDVNVHHLPLLSAEDFRPIDDDKINSYYGMEFDRLSRVFPEWKSEHEPFGVYEHDEDDGFVVSHGLIYNTNCIYYTTEHGISRVTAAASLRRYDTATVESAKPSVINGFDAMVYSWIGELDERHYAADIEMGHSYVTITTVNVGEEAFLNILDAYTAADEGSEDNQNHTQTMEDKIVILDEPPEFVYTKSWPFKIETDESFNENDTFIRYSMSELNDFYGINVGCLSELHPDWVKRYTERSLGIYVHDFDDIQTDNMAVSGGRAIVWTKNKLDYATTDNGAISTSVMRHTLSEEEIGSSVVNGYNAVIFQKLGNYGEVWAYGAAVQMNGTLVFITAENLSEEEFIDLVREYTSEASKFKRSSKPLPTQNESTTFTAYNSVEYEIQYEVDFSVASYWLKSIYNERFAKKVENLHFETLGYDESLDYLQDFFESDALPVDEQYIHDLKWYISDGHFTCSTQDGAKAYTPVNGKVVAVCDGSWYNGGLGNAVAVEFDNTSYFIMGHLDEVNVEVGDSVKAGDVLGVCGRTGFVMADDPPMLTLITFVKLGD